MLEYRFLEILFGLLRVLRRRFVIVVVGGGGGARKRDWCVPCSYYLGK